MCAARVGFYIEATAFAAYCPGLVVSGASTIFAVVNFDGNESHSSRKYGDEHCEGGEDVHGS